jgi:hypothetical protein
MSIGNVERSFSEFRLNIYVSSVLDELLAQLCVVGSRSHVKGTCSVAIQPVGDATSF